MMKLKLLYIYNTNDANEINLLDRVKDEIGSIVQEVIILDAQEAKDKFFVSKTPALIPMREDLQGDFLLTEDPANTGKLRAFLEAQKILEEEESVIYNISTKRIDNIVNKRVQDSMSENYQVMQDMAALLTESGVL